MQKQEWVVGEVRTREPGMKCDSCDRGYSREDVAGKPAQRVAIRPHAPPKLGILHH